MASGVWPVRSVKTISRVLAAVILALLFLTWNQAHFWTARTVVPETQRCLAKGKFNQDNVGLIVKTGASEAFEKLPAQIETVLGCAQNLLIVSDLDFELAGHHIHDVLQDVSPAVRDNNPVFEIYHQQRRLRDEGYTMEQLGVTSSSHNVAWELDKFKFLPMVYKAYTDIPNKDWYVFLEADTYLNWNNLLAWLSQLDASEKLYVGSPSFMAGTKFNHGGSGYILSRAAIRAFAEEYPAVASIWDARTTNECCGDYVLTLALKEFGVPVSGVWPMLSGEPPLEIPFGPALWCQSVITLHHVTSTDLRKMWSFERELDRTQRHILFQDLYKHWLPDGLPSTRADWDNRCPGSVFDINAPKASADSIEECGQACENVPYCMQYLYRKGECRLYKCFTLGKAATPSEDIHWQSVWRTDRITAWIDAHSECTVDWIPQDERNQRHGGVL